jgi:transposase
MGCSSFCAGSARRRKSAAAFRSRFMSASKPGATATGSAARSSSRGYEAYEIEPASVAVDRRARRAKSDGVDVDKLARTARALCAGELDACRIVAVPSEAEEDAKRPRSASTSGWSRNRPRNRNRVKALLFALGVRDLDPMAADRLERLAGLPIKPRLKVELIRECRRLAGIIADIAEVEAEMKAQAVPPKKPNPQARPHAAPSPAEAKAAQLMRLKSIGVHFSAALAREVYYRTFPNRRGVGQYIGLAPSPFQSGEAARGQGIAKAGAKRARKAMIELSWLWVQRQPDSALSRWFPRARRRQEGARAAHRHRRHGAQTRRCAVALPRDRRPEGAVLKRA